MEFLSDEIQKYVSEHTTKAPEYLNELERETWVKVIMPRMLSGHVQGQLLKLFTLMKRPKYILEVGTFTGYASHYLVEGLAEDGEFHAIEINEELGIHYPKILAKESKVKPDASSFRPCKNKIKRGPKTMGFHFP